MPSTKIFGQHSTSSITVGEPYRIQCSVNTSEKVNNDIVNISWSVPDGFKKSSSRIFVHPTVSDDDIIHNSTLQFLYLSQNDTGLFTCNVTIVDTTLLQSFQLDNITSEFYSYVAQCYSHIIIVMCIIHKHMFYT